MSQSSVFQIFERIESTASRNDMVSILVRFFRNLTVEESQIFSYLLQGRLSPLFVNKEFHFSERSALKVLDSMSKMYGLGVDVFALRGELGDAGLVAKKLMELNGNSKSSFDVNGLYESLWAIMNIDGTNSVKAKSDIFSQLILEASPIDAKFLTRIISGKLRLGCSDKTILDTFSFLLVGNKSARELLDSAYGVVTDLGFVANIVYGNEDIEKTLNTLKEMIPVPGIPIFPRLVERVASFDNISDRFPEGGVLQPKFDGLRCQVHKGVEYSNIYEKSIWSQYIDSKKTGFSLFEKSSSREDIKLFSRNLNDITEMFPEIVEQVRGFKEESFILDGEIVGWNEKTKKFIPFQETMSRKRKYGIVEKVKSVPVKYFSFDILFLNGRSLLAQDLEKRIKSISEVFSKEMSFVNLSENVFFSGGAKGLEKVRGMFEKYVGNGLEGLILKKLKGGYLPGVRNFDWIKVKKSIESKVVDTIDAVVLGYYYGSGKKTEFGMGSLLLGVYNSEDDVFESVGKLGTGFTDKDWGIISERLAPLEGKHKFENIRSELKADVWIQPDVVVSVESDEISRSSLHFAGRSKLGFGLSLRFPRLVSFDRDKLAQDCTSVDELIEMWEMNS